MHPVRAGVQPVSSQKSTTQSCVAPRASSLSSAADSETEKNADGRRSSATRRAVTHSTSASWWCPHVQRAAGGHEGIVVRLDVLGMRDVAQDADQPALVVQPERRPAGR